MRLFGLICLFLMASSAECIDHRFSGQIKTQSTGRWYESEAPHAQLGPDSQFSQDFEVRLMSETRQGPFELVLHGESLAIAGTAVGENRKVSAAIQRPYTPFPSDDRRLFDVSKEVFSAEDLASVTRFDRMYLAYTEGPIALRAGRQTITWGNGLLFQVMDLFNPFSPTEIDKDYKGGDDLLYAQYLYDSGDDTQILVVPRRELSSGHIRDQESSFAAKHHITRLDYDLDLLLAQHYDEQILGLGFSREVRGGVFRIDGTLTHSASDQTFYSVVANIDRSWTVAGVNIYTLLEYFYNGFGVDEPSYQSAPDSLQERFLRSELFTAGRQYAAAGIQIELSALMNLFMSTIHNIRDSSGVAQLRLEIDLLDNVDIYLGLNLPYGSRGSEFGGVQISDSSFLSPARELYLRAGYYF